MQVGVVGRTGSGKSSLLGALLRLWQLTDGAIYIDSVDISQVTLPGARACMAHCLSLLTFMA
jgi:ABC-type multidrug transport system fused ATPase/permease subunit